MTLQGLFRVGRPDLAAAQVLLPFYWLLMGVATIRAARELVLRPFYWFKSPHRLTAPPETRRLLRRRRFWKKARHINLTATIMLCSTCAESGDSAAA